MWASVGGLAVSLSYSLYPLLLNWHGVKLVRLGCGIRLNGLAGACSIKGKEVL